MKLNKDIINHREEDFGGLIINLKTGKIFKVNKIGYKIFLMLYKDISLKELLKDIEKDFKESKNKIKTDIEAFINELIAKGFTSKN